MEDKDLQKKIEDYKLSEYHRYVGIFMVFAVLQLVFTVITTPIDPTNGIQHFVRDG